MHGLTNPKSAKDVGIWRNALLPDCLFYVESDWHVPVLALHWHVRVLALHWHVPVLALHWHVPVLALHWHVPVLALHWHVPVLALLFFSSSAMLKWPLVYFRNETLGSLHTGSNVLCADTCILCLTVRNRYQLLSLVGY